MHFQVAKPLLSNEQIQQFITSTVLPSGRSVTSTETVNPDVTVYPSQPGARIQQQTDFTNVQPQRTLNELRCGQTLPWVSNQQQSHQKIVLQKPTEIYNDQSTVQQLILNSQGNFHPLPQNAFAVQFLHPPTLSHAGQHQPISANQLILPTNVQGSTPTVVPNEYVMVKGQQVPTNIISVPSVTGVYDQTVHIPTQAINGISSNCYYNGANVVTSTPKVATTGLSADFHQRCSAAQHQLETWSLRPLSVPTFVAPMEAQTKTKTKKPKKNTTANVSKRQNANADIDKCVLYSGSNMAKGNKGLAKIDVRSVQQTTGKQMEPTLHQTQNSASTSSLKGDKGVKRIVVPPKVQTDPVEYPPYVARIMRILNKQKQGQVESSDENKKSFDSTPKQMTTAGKDIKDRADSTPTQCITDKKAIPNSVDSTINQNEPQSLRSNETSQNVVSRTAVPSKQPALEQKIQHKSLSDNTVKKANEGCTQLKSGCRNEPGMSIKKTLPEDYRPVVNTDLLLDDWSPDSFTLLEADSFYGPEILVTSGVHCFVASVPFF
ncbi:uncharacterized protein LOC134272490 [Saccostrea cucullata]|uniref:uncharacterized protein LOC134272490 n=1 Tax=Saccostrea cuccullata TaxID=36930 RepID=UPI002ED2EFAA